MNDYDNILKIINSMNITSQNSFDIASKCSTLLAGNEEDVLLARRIIIHILDKWSYIPCETYPIWTDIVEAVGFYPYIEKNSATMSITTLSDEIRQKSYLSEYLPSTYLHKEQKKLSDLILSGKNIIASAPTSFGKSLLIEEIVASNRYKNIVIIQPTLALLDETRLKLKKYSSDYKIIVRTSQEPSEEKGNLFLLTAERVMEYNPLPHIDLLIIDEFYKLSLRRIDERADTLNNAFLKIVHLYNSKFYLLGPNIDGITDGFAEKYNAVFYKSHFSLVECNVFNYSSEFDLTKSKQSMDKQKILKLYQLLDELGDEQTLIYCSTPARARRFAKGYFEHLSQNNTNSLCQLPVVEWIDKNISPNWSLSKELSYGIAFHDGSLQKHLGASIIKYFNEGKLRCVFCTSTIIEGVNTSAKNVVLLDDTKGGKPIDFFDYSNIKGRSGRLMEHYVGKIYNFVPEPKHESIIIDIPFYEQDPKLLSNEILINIDTKDVQAQVLDRYNKLYEIDSDLMEIIKKNGANVNGQVEIYSVLSRDINTSKYNNISWTRMPNWENMLYILSLAENTLFSFKDRHDIVSAKQLAYYISQYREKESIMAIVRQRHQEKIKKAKNINTNKENDYWDKIIEECFHIYRHWFKFIVPKAFRVIDSLQRYVCLKNGKKAGSYSYFVQQMENDFVRENLSILIEYGIPSDTVRKLASNIPDNLLEDEVVEYIKNHKAIIYKSLLQYEIERLESSL